ncbi:flagellar biosynthesis protein FlaG [Campylobacter novaezeelandiae]|uniref:Flagellar biosynthesis protein FlaG n=1 Tax=Campylobacter novaezeelandiae TaxID=2267891 RepID=A0A4Q9JTY8_9BACT|nr:FlaG family protein [Campylobacter novaezeelandiae]MBK1964212.1 flagellar protein FlaG [Campylobacter novaezeelandiae]MBK1993277.1 flagellar protein FlaG [Campylobacter novaezeelandiae]QWU80272.1 flagellar protein FlaG [Campylobacter novaezeelandiae]TBR80020.1 flagellar biosynthesis protein FlaG [Campylobacter novaezeelandiae]TBR81065.1 flagellar biosynthesis protein FlaG [Campylobacter novaezeelandiae]
MEVTKLAKMDISNNMNIQNNHKTNEENIQKVQENSKHSKEIQEGLGEKLSDITKKLNEQMDSLNTNIRFAFNDKIGSMYISVTEKNTGREIRQIPSEEAMRLAEYFRDALGLIYNKES